MIETEKFVRKPLYVDAVRITTANFDEIVKWCQGEVHQDEVPGQGSSRQYIKVRVHNPKNQRQMKAFVGDWLLYTDRGYKIYTNKAFHASFDAVDGDKVAEDATEQAYPYQNGDFTLLGPQIFGAYSEDGEFVINYKGENFVAQTPADPDGGISDAQPIQRERIEDEENRIGEPVDPQVVADTMDQLRESEMSQNEARAAMDLPERERGEGMSALPNRAGEPVDLSEIRLSAEEAVRLQEKHEAMMGEFVPSEDDEAVADISPAMNPNDNAARETEEASPIKIAGKRVLSQVEQEELGPDEIRELLKSGDVVLEQDLAV